MQAARHYWIATVTPDGKPHAVPVWGVWVSDALFFGGGADTRWARNLAANPQVSVHLESASDVVIFEGTVEQINDPAHPLAAPVEAAYVAKYNTPHGLPVWRLLPHKALAWTRFFDDATRWTW
jgi:nitroimidazol reductase NimA-like FMN-containing flavoprotein (pyridoxamine 5'-phosphate oxidase superfamily)